MPVRIITRVCHVSSSTCISRNSTLKKSSLFSLMYLMILCLFRSVRTQGLLFYSTGSKHPRFGHWDCFQAGYKETRAFLRVFLAGSLGLRSHFMQDALCICHHLNTQHLQLCICLVLLLCFSSNSPWLFRFQGCKEARVSSVCPCVTWASRGLPPAQRHISRICVFIK